MRGYEVADIRIAFVLGALIGAGVTLLLFIAL